MLLQPWRQSVSWITTLAIRSAHSFKRTQRDDRRAHNGPFKEMRALAHLLMLHAITLHATTKHTFTIRRTRSLPMPCARFSSECVASMPARILYRSFQSVVCWSAYISSRRRISGVISRRKSPTVARGWHPLARWLGARTGHCSSIEQARHRSPSKIACSDRRVELFPLSTR